jgi:hypothetical protein
MACINNANPLAQTSIVDASDMPSAQGENDLNALALQYFCDQPAPMK